MTHQEKSSKFGNYLEGISAAICYFPALITRYPDVNSGLFRVFSGHLSTVPDSETTWTHFIGLMEYP